MLPNLFAAKLRSSAPLRGGGSFAIKVFAASILNFGLDVRAGAPRRSHANSFRINMLRFVSSTDAWRERSALESTNALYPPSYSKTLPSTTSQIFSEISSRNQRSWVITTTESPARSLRCAANQATPSTSRWFVGSSSRIRSRSSTRSLARFTRRRSPPESEWKARSKRSSLWPPKSP